MNIPTIIITGAAGGIGRAIALSFARHSCNLVLNDLDEQSLQSVGQALADHPGVSVSICAGDLADPDLPGKLVSHAMEKFGSIDILINNAAWRTLQSLRSIDRSTWQRTLDVCLTAPAFLIKMVAHAMEEQGVGGVVINVSSMMSDRAAGNSPAYIAVKAGLEGLTREAAVTYGRSGIRVLCVRPGYIETGLSLDYEQDAAADGMARKLEGYITDATPLGRAGSPYEVADVITWLCSAEASFITGTCLTIDGGFSVNMNSYPLKKLQFPDEY
jgi:NAD(P)-dependent dehydrogenase (short-subunit alcohol dehydrogenase family)